MDTNELDNWYNVRYRISNEGMEYCFKRYSSFEEIKDEDFHTLRKKLIDTINQMNEFVENKITDLEERLIDED